MLQSIVARCRGLFVRSNRSLRIRRYRLQSVPVGSALEARVLLSAITVNTTADENDGIAVGGISLRDAILEANTTPTDDTITLPAGTYTFTKAGLLEDGAFTGDLDIANNEFGGGFWNNSTLNVTNSTLSANSAAGQQRCQCGQ